MLIMPSFKKSSIVEQFQGNYLKYLWIQTWMKWLISFFFGEMSQDVSCLSAILAGLVISLLQRAMDSYYKLRQLFYYKVRHGLLRVATGITKCDGFIKNCNRYYKVQWLLQIVTLQRRFVACRTGAIFSRFSSKRQGKELFFLVQKSAKSRAGSAGYKNILE